MPKGPSNAWEGPSRVLADQRDSFVQKRLSEARPYKNCLRTCLVLKYSRYLAKKKQTRFVLRSLWHGMGGSVSNNFSETASCCHAKTLYIIAVKLVVSKNIVGNVRKERGTNMCSRSYRFLSY